MQEQDRFFIFYFQVVKFEVFYFNELVFNGWMYKDWVQCLVEQIRYLKKGGQVIK